MGRAIPITLHDEHVHHILACIGRADAETAASAQHWYRDWARYLTHRAEVDGLPLDTAIVAFAWLSANKSLDRNLQLFEEYVYNGAANTNGLSRRQRNKLLAIHMSGEPLKYLTSPKVRSFAINLLTSCTNVQDSYTKSMIARASCQATVTIDRHAAQCAYDDRSIVQVPLWMYKTVSLAYQAVAGMLGWDVKDVQALAWVQWRKEKTNLRGRKRGAQDPDARRLLEWSAGVQV